MLVKRGNFFEQMLKMCSIRKYKFTYRGGDRKIN